ncbi:MAG: hypothetical protein LBR71_01330 [Synergistaceae bacterium]|jgi:hypothetical protein|nr:hypothetical protein [Synergistaceae bacterium]
MSKPDKPGELRDVELDAISLVTKAANGERFKIFKNAKENEEPQAPAPDEKDERGLFHVLKAFFSGIPVEKGELANNFNAREKGHRLGTAIDALWSTIGLNRYGGESEKAETDSKKLRGALEDFKKIAEEILLGKDEDIAKVAAEIEKSGRKIAGARLAELKAAHAALSKIIEEADGEPDAVGEKGDVNEVTKEELLKIVKTGIDEGTKPLLERLEKLEKANEPGDETPQEGTKPETKPEIQESDIAEIVKNAMAEAIAPLTERLEKVEKARGVSNKIPEDTDVEKSTSVFSGVFMS